MVAPRRPSPAHQALWALVLAMIVFLVISFAKDGKIGPDPLPSETAVPSTGVSPSTPQ